MLIRPLSVVTQFIDSLNESLKALDSSAKLSFIQRNWLRVILMGIVVTGTLNWAGFERRSLGQYSQDRLRWIFRMAGISWELLLLASVKHIIKSYGITHGVLIADDTDKRRCKKTTRIANAHKVKDKKTGGYFNGQELIFLVIVADTVTFPVGFRFYVPDPSIQDWKKKNEQMKQQGIPKKERPKCPSANSRYPTKPALTIQMIEEFVLAFPTFKVDAVLADALYGQADFMNKARKLTGNSQVVSQLRHNQRVNNRTGCVKSVREYFTKQPCISQKLTVRGGEKVPVVMIGARLMVKAHGQRRFIVALKYEGEMEYRFLVATNLSWRHEDIARLYTLRWLIEVFIEDWKGFGGWNRLAKHQGEEGSMRGVILSLLCDHLLLVHPKQSARLKNKQPGMPVGCLIEHLNAEALIDAVKAIVADKNPIVAFKNFSELLLSVLPDRPSKKHMAGRDLGRIDFTPSLAYQSMM